MFETILNRPETVKRNVPGQRVTAVLVQKLPDATIPQTRLSS